MKSSRAALTIVIWVVLTTPGLVVGADNLLAIEESHTAEETGNAGHEKSAASNRLRKKYGAADKSTRYGVGYEFRMKKPRQTKRARGSGRSHRSSRAGRRR